MKGEVSSKAETLLSRRVVRSAIPRKNLMAMGGRREDHGFGIQKP
jgi:hypothetical protein